MKLRSLALGLSLLTAGTVIGVSTQQFVSADISSGDRPVLIPIEPCRLVDTRPGDSTIGPKASRLGAADTMTVAAQEPDTECTGAIPAAALSLSLNVTAVGATELTFLTIWAGGNRPLSSSLNPAPGQPPTPNAVTVDLSAAQEFVIYNNLGSVNLIVDVNGYYENHNHDDLYYTKTDVDSLVDLGERTVVIPPSAFRSLNPGNSLVAGNIYGAYMSATDGSTQSTRAPLDIPVGSTISSVTYHYTDNSAARGLLLAVTSASLTGNSQSIVTAFEVDTTGASASVRSSTLTPNYVVTDSSALSLVAFDSAWASVGRDLAVKGVVVTYTLP